MVARLFSRPIILRVLFPITMFPRMNQAMQPLSQISSIGSGLSRLILSVIFCLSPNGAAAHGGVAFEEDLCLISIDFLQAHFTVYQPQTRANREYCEDIPDVSRAVFVMEYLHEFLQEMPVDFRIVRDVEGIGFVYFDDKDVVRHKLVQQIVKAYEAFTNGGAPRTHD